MEITKKQEVTVYKDATKLFSEKECDEDNLTTMRVEPRLIKAWLKETRDGRTVAEFLVTQTADQTIGLVYWLLNNGHALDVPERAEA